MINMIKGTAINAESKEGAAILATCHTVGVRASTQSSGAPGNAAIDYPARLFQARKIITLAESKPEAMVVVGERVVATGVVTELRQRFPDAESSDFGAAVIVPGFNDAHMHPAHAAEDLLHVDVAANVVRSNAEVVATLRRAAEQTPPARQALELYTLGGAYASGEHRIKGRLVPGYLADFVVLEQDPLETDPMQLGAIPVRATYVGGEPVWQAA
jgi:predicted amidohydrolase YtcJ